jgi:hypothetical protein
MTRAARPFADSAALQHLFGGALNKVGHGFLDECSLRHVGNGHGHRAVLIRLNPDASNQLSCATNPLRDALIVPAQPHARRQRLLTVAVDADDVVTGFADGFGGVGQDGDGVVVTVTW